MLACSGLITLIILAYLKPLRSVFHRVVSAETEKASALGLALAGASPIEVPAAGAQGRRRTVFFVDQDAARDVPENLIASSY